MCNFYEPDRRLSRRGEDDISALRKRLSLAVAGKKNDSFLRQFGSRFRHRSCRSFNALGQKMRNNFVCISDRHGIDNRFSVTLRQKGKLSKNRQRTQICKPLSFYRIGCEFNKSNAQYLCVDTAFFKLNAVSDKACKAQLSLQYSCCFVRGHGRLFLCRK